MIPNGSVDVRGVALPQCIIEIDQYGHVNVYAFTEERQKRWNEIEKKNRGG